MVRNYRVSNLAKDRFLKTVTWDEAKGRDSLNSIRVVPEILGA